MSPRMLTDLPPLLKAEDVAILLGVDRKTIYTQIRRRQLPFIRIGKRNIRFDRDEILRLLDSGRTPAESRT